jgi:hypothetical protein
MHECFSPLPTCAFTDVRGNRNRGTAQLRCKAKAFLGRKTCRERIDLLNERHRLLPHFKIAKRACHRHESLVPHITYRPYFGRFGGYDAISTQILRTSGRIEYENISMGGYAYRQPPTTNHQPPTTYHSSFNSNTGLTRVALLAGRHDAAIVVTVITPSTTSHVLGSLRDTPY